MDIRKNESGLYEVEIEGQKYEFEKWGAEESFDVLVDIAKIVGKPVGTMVTSVMENKPENNDVMKTEITGNMLGMVFDALSEKLDKAVVKTLFKKFNTEKVLCDGKKINFNNHYQDRLLLSFQVARAGLEVQYGNFFLALLELIGVRGQRAVTGRIQAV